MIAEAEQALKRKLALIPARIENVDPPFGFESLQAAELVNWEGDESSPAFKALHKGLTAVLGVTSPPQEAIDVPAAPEQQPEPANASSPGLSPPVVTTERTAETKEPEAPAESVDSTPEPAPKKTLFDRLHDPKFKRWLLTTAAAATVLVVGYVIFQVRQEPVELNRKDGLEYVRILAETFQMGCVPGDDDCESNEKPRHRVEITKDFWMSRREVTVAAHKRFVEATSHEMPEAPSFNPSWGEEDHPIVNVSWDAAAAYCKWAGGRLPTEAEWEYAACGGKEGLLYPWGNEISSKNAKYHSEDGTAAVGSYPANGFGLYDMAGNVWEWCADFYAEDYYVSSTAQDPQGSPSGEMRVVRGGSWDDAPEVLRASVRDRSQPGLGSDIIGFRCVREVSP